MDLKDRIRQARQDAELTQEALAGSVRPPVTKQAVTQWESGEAVPAMKTMLQLPVILNVSSEWLFTGRQQQSQVVPGLELRGEIGAGVWKEITESQEMEFERVPVAPDPRYPVDAQFALRIRGNSVNRIARDGSIVVCVDIHKAHIAVQNNDLVVVERRQGHLLETTVKRYRNGKEGPELWPESDDPLFQEKLTLGRRKAGTEVSIRAIIILVANAVPRGG